MHRGGFAIRVGAAVALVLLFPEWPGAAVAEAPAPAASAAAPAGPATGWRPDSTSALTTVVLVRHAEKDTLVQGSDPPLDVKGFLRAQVLERVLRDLPLRRIVVTSRQRNRQTAQPLAASRGDTLTVIDGVERTVEALRAEPRGSTVLVVGHSNTLPQIIEGLTGRPFPTPDLVPYDGMWIVTRTIGGETRLLTLHYGPPDDVAPERTPPAKATSKSSAR
jgi:phosphohistidine phosphatase SixA